MNLLAIDTATDQLGVALVDETRVLASYEVLAERIHAIELPQAVTRVLQAAHLTLPQVDAIAVDIGPGAFTGLRIGAAFVKALAFTAKKPVIGVPSLDVLAAGVPCAQSLVCPMLDAKQRKVYAARYRTTNGALRKQSDYELLSVDELLPTFGQEEVIVLGNGAALYRDRLQQVLGNRVMFADPALGLPNAAVLGRLGLERLNAGQRDDPSTLVPMYLHPRHCTIRPELLQNIQRAA